METTQNLKLPQYTEDDVFDLTVINEAHNKIDTAYKEMADFRDEIPTLHTGIVENENIRISNENARITNENTRVSNEALRDTRENTRVSNENDRASSERTRVSNESNRTNSENKRVTNENARISDENVRKQNESTRVSNESTRLQNEALRVEKENLRTQSENTRITEENKRKTSFAEMQSQFNEIKQNNSDINNAKIDYFGKEHSNIANRLNSDFDNIHQKVNDSTYLEYEGTSISATDSYYGLVKDFNVKGRTLQNLCPKAYNINFTSNGSWLSAFLYQKGSEYNSYMNYTNIPLKPNTVYTVICNVVKNTSDTEIDLNNYDSSSSLIKENMRIPINKTGIMIFKGSTISDFSSLSLQVVLRCQNRGATVGEVEIKDIIILEGDYTNTPISDLPYGEGIYSVGENENNKISLKTTGKNLIDLNKFKSTANVDVTIEGNKITLLGLKESKYVNSQIRLSRNEVNLIRNKTVTLSCSSLITSTKYPEYAIAQLTMEYPNGSKKYLGISPRALKQQIEIGNVVSIVIGLYTTNNNYLAEQCDTIIEDLQLEIAEEETPYEPYQENIYNVQLSEPLRSLPNGVCDEITDDGKVIRRVGKAILDGSYNIYHSLTSIEGKKRWIIWTDRSIKDVSSRQLTIMCDKFPTNTASNTWDGQEGICQNSAEHAICLAIDKYSDGSAESKLALTQELKNNPVTVYYELAEPIIEEINFNEQIKSYDGATHIYSTNTLQPNISCKIPTNVQAVVMSLKKENESLNNTISKIEEREIENIETNLDQEIRLTMLELGVM